MSLRRCTSLAIAYAALSAVTLAAPLNKDRLFLDPRSRSSQAQVTSVWDEHEFRTNRLPDLEAEPLRPNWEALPLPLRRIAWHYVPQASQDSAETLESTVNAWYHALCIRLRERAQMHSTDGTNSHSSIRELD